MIDNAQESHQLTLPADQIRGGDVVIPMANFIDTDGQRVDPLMLVSELAKAGIKGYAVEPKDAEAEVLMTYDPETEGSLGTLDRNSLKEFIAGISPGQDASYSAKMATTIWKNMCKASAYRVFTQRVWDESEDLRQNYERTREYWNELSGSTASGDRDRMQILARDVTNINRELERVKISHGQPPHEFRGHVGPFDRLEGLDIAEPREEKKPLIYKKSPEGNETGEPLALSEIGPLFMERKRTAFLDSTYMDLDAYYMDLKGTTEKRGGSGSGKVNKSSQLLIKFLNYKINQTRSESVIKK